jgi:hypothetical protein
MWLFEKLGQSHDKEIQAKKSGLLHNSGVQNVLIRASALNEKRKETRKFRSRKACRLVSLHKQ